MPDPARNAPSDPPECGWEVDAESRRDLPRPVQIPYVWDTDLRVWVPVEEAVDGC